MWECVRGSEGEREERVGSSPCTYQKQGEERMQRQKRQKRRKACMEERKRSPGSLQGHAPHADRGTVQNPGESWQRVEGRVGCCTACHATPFGLSWPCPKEIRIL